MNIIKIFEISVVVIIWDFESRDGGSIPPKRRVFFIKGDLSM